MPAEVLNPPVAHPVPDRPLRLRVPLLVGGGLAVVLAVALLIAPPLGTDLSAQAARADFVRSYGLTPVDLRWYGGTVQYAYSLVSPALMAALGGGALGARLVGALSLVASTVGFAVLLLRTRVPRPALGVALSAGTFAGNLVSGRVTFALGVACGVWALAASTAGRPALRYGGAAVAALVAGAASPVAGLFVGLAGTALLLSGSLASGLVLAGSAAVPLIVDALVFTEGGRMNISTSDAVHAIVTGLAVAVAVPIRPVRIGAVLSSVGVAAAYLFDTPVGLNATRLATMFALQVLAACLPWRRWPSVVGACVALLLWQPPVIVDDLRDAGNPAADRRYFAPLLDELARRAPIGRIEIPPTRDYWEAAYAAQAVPLARGWLRQVDMARNGLFFDGRLTAASYQAWLRDNGVSYVAVPDTALSWVGAPEADLARSGVPYLHQVWRSVHWALYQVADAPSIVDGGTLVSSTGAAVTFDAPGAGTVLVRVAPLHWLHVTGPAAASIEPRGRWIVVRVDRPGRYTVTSG